MKYINKNGPVLKNNIPLRKWWKKFKKSHIIIKFIDPNGYSWLNFTAIPFTLQDVKKHVDSL